MTTFTIPGKPMGWQRIVVPHGGRAYMPKESKEYKYEEV